MGFAKKKSKAAGWRNKIGHCDKWWVNIMKDFPVSSEKK
jgi:hypothetical protein